MTEGRIENISVSRMLELCHEAEPWELELLEAAARYSDPLLAGFYGDDLLCIVGFASKTILSDEAYIWLCSTNKVPQHTIVFGRWAKRLINGALTRYPRIIGHCNKDNVSWLRQLGARFGAVNGLIEFEIVRGDV